MCDRRLGSCLLVLFVLFLLPVAGLAQDDGPPLELRLRRDFGYGSGLQMQGRFSMRVAAPDSVERVAFLIDGVAVAEDGEAPYVFRFSTGSYADGWHTMEAAGYTADGESLPSNAIRREFVPQGAANTYLIIVLALVVGFVVLRYVLTRDDSGANYGLLGGAICPHCGRPFAYHVWGVNLMVGRLDRCRHCGKWSFTRRQSPQALARAEGEMAGAPEAEGLTLGEEERLRQQLESSRYDEGT